MGSDIASQFLAGLPMRQPCRAVRQGLSRRSGMQLVPTSQSLSSGRALFDSQEEIALTEFLAKHRTSKISERLDAVYSAEESRVDAATAGAQRAVLRRSEW